MADPKKVAGVTVGTPYFGTADLQVGTPTFEKQVLRQLARRAAKKKKKETPAAGDEE